MTDTTNIELGVLPDDWVISTLDDFVRKESSIRYGIVQPGDYDPEGRFMVRGQDYSKGWNAPHTFFRVSPIIEERYKNARLSAGDLIMTIVGACGHIEVVPNWLDGANITQTTARIPLKHELISTTYVLNFFRFHFGINQVKNHIKGAVQPGLNIGDVRNFKVVCPPLEEQHAIAEVLSDVDELIAQTERLIAKKKAVKMGVMHELLRPKAGWNAYLVDDVATVHGGGTPSTSITEYWGGDINWFTPTEVGSKKYLFESERTITEKGLSRSSAKLLPEGTILFTSRAGIGDLGILTIEAATNQGFQSLVVKTNFHNEFIYYLLQMKKTEFLRYSSGSTFLEISPTSLKSVLLEVPTKEKQHQIAQAISVIDEEILALKAKAEKYRHLKSAFMYQLLTGKTRLV